MRETVETPFDVDQLPSPLAEFKGFANSEDDTPLFRLSGDPADRIRLAALDGFDGSVWRLASVEDASFVRVSENVDAEPRFIGANSITSSFEIIGLDGSFLPTPGAPDILRVSSDIENQDVNAAELVRVDRSTGNTIVGDGLQSLEGLQYEVVSQAPPLASEDFQLVDATPFAAARYLGVPELPSQISELAASLPQGASTLQTVESLQDVLRTQAYSLDAAPGHSLARLADFASTQPIVGHDEQYSALMTLVLRSAGIPSRVVVGFVPDSEEVEGLAAGESVDVMADDVEAWVEVPFDGCLLYTSPSPRDQRGSRMPSSA